MYLILWPEPSYKRVVKHLTLACNKHKSPFLYRAGAWSDLWSRVVNSESDYLHFKNKYIFLACFLIITKARLFKLCIDWFEGYLNTQ